MSDKELNLLSKAVEHNTLAIEHILKGFNFVECLGNIVIDLHIKVVALEAVIENLQQINLDKNVKIAGLEAAITSLKNSNNTLRS